MPRSVKTEGSVIGGVFIAFLILIFHVGLLALIGLVVLFLSGILNYLAWILLGGLLVLVSSGYLFMRRIASKSGSIVKFLNLPELRDKNIEVKVLGGMASVKISGSRDPAGESLPGPAADRDGLRRLQSPESEKTDPVGRLARLAEMLEADLITRDEYMQAKQRLLE